jgi:hypothetical protein
MIRITSLPRADQYSVAVDIGGACKRTEVSGWPRLTSAVCGEYARKLLWVRRFRWSQACSLGTVNPSRKLRRFESFTCHHVLRGPLTSGNVGWGPFRVVRASFASRTGRCAVIWSNRLFTVVSREYVGKLRSRSALRQPRSAPTPPKSAPTPQTCPCQPHAHCQNAIRLARR